MALEMVTWDSDIISENETTHGRNNACDEDSAGELARVGLSGGRSDDSAAGHRRPTFEVKLLQIKGLWIKNGSSMLTGI